MKPIEQAVSDTLITLKSVRSFLLANRNEFEETFPHDYLDEVDVECHHLYLELSHPDSRFNSLDNNEKLILLHHANDAFFNGQHIVTDSVEQFRLLSHGIGVLYKAADAVDYVREGIAPLEKIRKEVYNLDRLGNVAGQRKADVWEQFLYNINSLVNFYAVNDDALTDDTRKNEASVLSGLAITTFDMARNEVFNKSEPDETKVAQLSQLTQDFMHFGLRCDEEAEEKSISPAYRLLHDETVRNYALGL